MSVSDTAKIESYLFYSGDTESYSNIAKNCDISTKFLDERLSKLQSELEGRGVSLILHDDSAKLVISKEFSEFIRDIEEKEVNSDLTDAQSEALAVVAYLSPVQKMTIDFIRGVNSRAVLRNLSVRGLVTSSTKDSVSYYTVTSDALAHLGISQTEELPDYSNTREQLREFVQSDTRTPDQG
jgi:segregation and condensation protein B